MSEQLSKQASKRVGRLVVGLDAAREYAGVSLSRRAVTLQCCLAPLRQVHCLSRTLLECQVSMCAPDASSLRQHFELNRLT